jgi:FPC/CPF motif-containing protein YcgG
MRPGQFGELGTVANASPLRDALHTFSTEFENPGAVLVSFIALFQAASSYTEADFEARLWRQLQAMHALDHELGCEWNGHVSADPSRKDFSFSVGGRAFFVVGLHPGALRLARLTPQPCLVFSFHDQFESLKSTRKYQSMQEVIRARDRALQGSINPVLSRFGEASEARQYSGREVEADWKCPFIPHESASHV